MRMNRMAAGALLAGWGLALAAQSGIADDPVPGDKAPPQGQVIKVAPGARGADISSGVIRIIGPDGKVREQRFGSAAPVDHAELAKKLEELRAASGDPEAVERISQELLNTLKSRSGTTTYSTLAKVKLSYGIGVSLAPEVPAAVRAQLRIREREGVLVQSVAKDSPADKAGIKEYDLLMMVNGNTIDEHSDLVDAVQTAGEEKTELSLQYISGGESKLAQLTPTVSNTIAWPAHAGYGGQVPGVQFYANSPGMIPHPQAFTLQFPPGIVAPHNMNLRTPDGQVVPQVPLISPFEGQRHLEGRMEQLERKLDEIARRLPEAEERKKPE